MITPTNWGSIVRALRHEKGFSIKKLARFAQVSEHTISQLELGRLNTSVRILEQLLTVLDYELEALPLHPEDSK
jgi:transcriptional regulator with XRE-family HTH domain|tara:strand:+ start:552 stop:773 length:222 start_codon:yes stop_codon:yes gene_type:complete